MLISEIFFFNEYVDLRNLWFHLTNMLIVKAEFNRTFQKIWEGKLTSYEKNLWRSYCKEFKGNYVRYMLIIFLNLVAHFPISDLLNLTVYLHLNILTSNFLTNFSVYMFFYKKILYTCPKPSRELGFSQK